ncbi:hypothetical protein D1872_51770 [compost metagenome]
MRRAKPKNWKPEYDKVLEKYALNKETFSTHELAKEWGLGVTTLTRGIRECCNSRGWTVSGLHKGVEVLISPFSLTKKQSPVGSPKAQSAGVRYHCECESAQGGSIWLTVKAADKAFVPDKAKEICPGIARVLNTYTQEEYRLFKDNNYSQRSSTKLYNPITQKFS